MHKTGPFTNSGVSKFVKLVVVYTKHQQLNNTKNHLSLHTIHYLKLHERSNNNTLRSIGRVRVAGRGPIPPGGHAHHGSVDLARLDLESSRALS